MERHELIKIVTPSSEFILIQKNSQDVPLWYCTETGRNNTRNLVIEVVEAECGER